MKKSELSKIGMVVKPLVIMFEEGDGGVVCHIHPKEGYGHQHYGILICDLVRNVADAFGVKEDEVWKWVDKERHHHTSDITHP